MLASRGPVYRSAEDAGSGGNRYHARCGCTAEPFEGDPDEWEPTSDEQRYVDAYEAVHEPGMTGVETAAKIEEWLADPANAAPRFDYATLSATFDDASRVVVGDTIAAIQSLHKWDPDSINLAAYTPAEIRKIAAGQGGHFDYDHAAKTFEVRVRASGDYLRNATAHEIGHTIDLGEFGDDSGRRRTFGSKARKTSGMKAWYKAVTASQRMVELRGYSGAYVKYLSSSHEMFARSFAQWVAVRTGDRAMLDEIAAMLGHDQAKYLAWELDDFEPIAKALDEVFGVPT